MNNIKEIELDMWLILKQAEQDYIKSFNTPVPWKLYLEETDQGTIAYAVEDGKTERAFQLPIIKNNGTYSLGRLIWMSHETKIPPHDFEMKVVGFFSDNNLLRLKDTDISAYKIDVPEFSKEELKLFGPEVEFVFKNLKTLQPIGIGNFRLVYDLGDFVLKVARQNRGHDKSKQINQDEAQSGIHQDFPDLTVKTYKHAPDFSWIVQEKVTPVRNEAELKQFFPELKPIHGLRLDQIIAREIEKIPRLIKTPKEQGLGEEHTRNQKQMKKNYRQIKENFSPLIQQLTSLCLRYGVDHNDFKPKNFGTVTIGGQKRLVLLDIGTHFSRR